MQEQVQRLQDRHRQVHRHFRIYGASNGIVTSPSASATSVTPSSSSTTYTLTVTQSGCQATANTSISSNTVALSAAANASPSTVCKGSTTQLNANPAGRTGTYSHVWTITNAGGTNATTAMLTGGVNIQNPVFNPSTINIGGTVTFQDVVTDGFGCTTTTTVAVPVGAPVATIVETDASGVANDSKLCAGASATLTGPASSGSPAFAYSWATSSGTVTSPTASATSVTPSASSTTYTLTVTQSGCQATANATISANTVALSGAASSSAPSVCFGSSVTLNGNPAGGTGGILTTGQLQMPVVQVLL